MLTDDLRRRLEDLNRRRLPLSPTPVSPTIRTPRKSPVAIDRLGPAEIHPTPAGDCYTITRRLSEIWSHAPMVAREYHQALSRPASNTLVSPLSEDFRDLTGKPIDSALFLDVETCGLAASPIFLVGLMRVADDDFHFELLLARNYAEEPAILHRFLDRLSAARTLITFNGKSFDLPLVRERAAVHRMTRLPDKPHIDILHECRRAWKTLLPDCKLQTLEAYVLARTRRNDIPASEIPAAYHDFVLTGDAWLLDDVLHHNILDLATMAQLIPRLLDRKLRNVP